MIAKCFPPKILSAPLRLCGSNYLALNVRLSPFALTLILSFGLKSPAGTSWRAGCDLSSPKGFSPSGQRPALVAVAKAVSPIAVSCPPTSLSRARFSQIALYLRVIFSFATAGKILVEWTVFVQPTVAKWAHEKSNSIGTWLQRRAKHFIAGPSPVKNQPRAMVVRANAAGR